MSGVAFAAVWFAFGGCSDPLRADDARPNIVLIISDDHGWTDYGFQGHPHVQTPALDRLSEQSLIFTRGYVTSSLCCPSLASILTGRYPHQTKIANNDPPKPPGMTAAALARDESYQTARRTMSQFVTRVPTLPGVLKEHGYVSLQTGKWWQGQYSTGGFTHGMSHGEASRGGRHGDDGLAIGRQTMRPIFDFVDQATKDRTPFFVWYAPMLPHTPHQPPEALLAKYRDKTDSLSVAKYWAMVEWFDQTCGTLLEFLDGRGLAENTIVVYVTDNGWTQNPSANTPIRSKLTHFDAGHRTPIMIRWPGKVAPRRSPYPVSSIDIVPTLLSAVRLPAIPDLPGINLLDEKSVSARPAVFGECFTHDAVEIANPASSLRYRWVVSGDWRLAVPNVRLVPNAEPELYNVVLDPSEQVNRAAAEPARVVDLRDRLDGWWRP